MRSAICAGSRVSGTSTGSPPARSTAEAYCGHDLWLYSRSLLVGTGMAMRGLVIRIASGKRPLVVMVHGGDGGSQPLGKGVGVAGSEAGCGDRVANDGQERRTA